MEPLGLMHLDEFNILKIKDIGKLYDPCPTFLMNQMHEACSSLLTTVTITNSYYSPVLFLLSTTGDENSRKVMARGYSSLCPLAHAFHPTYLTYRLQFLCTR